MLVFHFQIIFNCHLALTTLNGQMNADYHFIYDFKTFLCKENSFSSTFTHLKFYIYWVSCREGEGTWDALWRGSHETEMMVGLISLQLIKVINIFNGLTDNSQQALI